MPYLKFSSDSEQLKARSLLDQLCYGSEVEGLWSSVRDDKHGLVYFISHQPYIDEIDKEQIPYDIIPKEDITAPYVDFLCQRHLEFADEL
ncbi:MAG: hypothetical protein ABIF40_02905 [archaeon]